jgi:hypothetical protein
LAACSPAASEINGLVSLVPEPNDGFVEILVDRDSDRLAMDFVIPWYEQRASDPEHRTGTADFERTQPADCRTTLLSSHLMSEMEQAADHIQPHEVGQHSGPSMVAPLVAGTAQARNLTVLNASTHPAPCYVNP